MFLKTEEQTDKASLRTLGLVSVLARRAILFISMRFAQNRRTKDFKDKRTKGQMFLKTEEQTNRRTDVFEDRRTDEHKDRWF